MNIKSHTARVLAPLLFTLFSSSAIAGYPVNINSADAIELADALDGIGQSKAEAIVAYRDENGPFNSVESLTSVRGIGVATVEKNMENILLKPAKPMGE
jgi:competence protein ComEA